MTDRFRCVLIAILINLMAICSAQGSEPPVFGPENFETGEWYFTLNLRSFSAENPGDGILEIVKTDPDNVPTGGFIIFNCGRIPLRDFLRSGEEACQRDISLKANNFMTVFFRGTPGASIRISVLDNSIQAPPPEVNITADPSSIMAGETSTLTWETTYAENVSIDNGIGIVSESGSLEVMPQETTTYTITATGPGGTGSAAVPVSVSMPPSLPEVTVSADPENITIGSSATLSWTSANAENIHIDNGIGPVSDIGSLTISPEHTTTYTITAIGSGGIANANMTVGVLGNPVPLPGDSFGKQYEDIIPADATVESYDERRFSIITGVVQNADNTPLEDVDVTIHDHPEYGTAETNEEGRFSIPVEGGRTIKVHYAKQGLVRAHRNVYVPWNDIAICEPIQMIAEDPISTAVTFDGNPGTITTHRSTLVTDEFGTRSCTIVFSGDNKAHLVDEDGNDIHELTTIVTRATEYAAPESMPAQLPPTSAFTYCVELSVDGADRVRFDEPLTSYVDNFLGFEVGEIVPVGSYNRDRGVWIPEENGVVVRLLDTDADGVVDALDADGDGQPDDLDGSGSFSDEVTGLNDPVSHPPGGTYWRFKAGHFSPWDLNWASGGLIEVIAPNPEGVPTADQQNEEPCPTACGSHVDDRSRILHQDIPIPGIDMNLHYSSNRVDGYKTLIDVPVSGETVPAELKRIVVQVRVSGRKFEKILDPFPDQKALFVWDGLDYRGRRVNNPVLAHIKIGFVYDAVYYSSTGVPYEAFARPGTEVTGVWARKEMTLWKRDMIPVTPSHALFSSEIAEGWSISSNHSLNRLDLSTLYKGDGSKLRNNLSVIKTVAGTCIGDCGGIGDDGPGTEAEVCNPDGIALDEMGHMLITDPHSHSVLKIDTGGIVTTIAGSGNPYDGFQEGAVAKDVHLWQPLYVTTDSEGNLYVANYIKVYKIDKNGMITTFAGKYHQAYSGDGGPAGEAGFWEIHGIASDTYGNFYISDHYNNRIRRVSPDGIITTFGGNGEETYSGDGGPAAEAGIAGPGSMVIDADGNVYVATDARIRKIDTSGIITTIAGNGMNYGVSEDFVPATETPIAPDGMAIDRKGNIYFTDGVTGTVRRVDTRGIITTVAGKSENGSLGDGGPATSAAISARQLAINNSGNILFTSGRGCIREVGPALIFSEVTETGDIPFADASGLLYLINGAGLHKKTLDLETQQALYTFEYDSFEGESHLSSITDQFGNRIGITNVNGVPYTIESPDGLVTQLDMDRDGHLIRITYPDGGSYDFGYTAGGLMSSKTEPNGNYFDYVYNEGGRIIDTYDGNNGHWQFEGFRVTTGENNVTTYLDEYYSTGKYTSLITGPTGDETGYFRSADGLSVYKSLPCGLELDFTYDADPGYKFTYIKQMTETTPSGLTKTTQNHTSYNDTDGDDIPELITRTVTVNDKAATVENNTVSVQKTLTSPEGRTLTSGYHPANLLTDTIRVPGFFDMSYEYDDRGRMTSMAVNTRETRFTYDGSGNLETITDPEGYTTTYAYDAAGRVTDVFRPDSSDLSYSYDNNGNMTMVINPSDISHGFGFNGINRVSSYQTPLSGNYSYLYDKDRRLVSTTFPSGKAIIHTYHNTRLVHTQTPEGSIDYSYLCGDNVGSIARGGESISYEYDANLVTRDAISGTLNQALDYTYNNDFRIDTFQYAGAVVSYTYDDDGLLTGSGNFTIERNLQNGLPESISGGPLFMDRMYNGYGEISDQDVSINGRLLSSWTVTRDNNGRVIEKTETVGGATSAYVYGYDTMGRLTTVTRDGIVVEQYSYSADGSREYETNSRRGITGRFLSYSDEDHLLTSGDAVYQYNLDGFLMMKTEGPNITSYTYSSRGELLSVILPDSTLVEYLHDPLGRRIAKKVDGAITERYLWQGLNRLLAIYDGAGNLRQRFEYAHGRMPAAMTQGAATYYLAYDQIGSLRLVADASGNVVKTIEYDSFGNIISDSNPSFAVPFGFAGGLYDRDTGLVRFGYRDYDPDVGRWTAKDPILFAGGDTDLYGYCLNDPVNLVDPSGQFVNLGTAGIGMAIGTGVGVANAFFSGGDIVQGALAGAVVGSLAGLSFGTSFIANSFAGASIGAMTDIASQHFSRPCSDIDSTSVVISAISGAVGGGASTAMLRGGATTADAVFFSGAISGGVSTGLYATVNY